MSYEDEMEDDVADAFRRLAWERLRRARQGRTPPRVIIEHMGPWHHEARFGGPPPENHPNARCIPVEEPEGEFPDGRRLDYPLAIEVRSRIAS